MARVAVVTGGTRGIGASISKALKAAGYKVAATYSGNDTATTEIYPLSLHDALPISRSPSATRSALLARACW